MPAKNSLSPVLKKVDLLVAEIAQLRASGPHFRVLYRFRMPGSSGRLPGQEIFAVFLVYRGREYQLRLTLAQRFVFEYLANHCRLAQNARQIELGIRADDFYKFHAKNANGRTVHTRRIPRSSIKEHVRRLHQALEMVFQEAGLGIEPRGVLIVQDTVGNEGVYRLRATCSRTYTDLTARDRQPLSGWRARIPEDRAAPSTPRG
jgi:hypothetical protein